ncbi:GDP-mannose-dependent alpha-(1-6)-phosphatidylinositol monomannoside mannosyltransferase [subsurface metagenome]
MNIFIFSLEFPPFAGGAGYYNYNLALGLAKIGHNVTVFTCSYPEKDEVLLVDEKLESKGIKIIRIKLPQKLKIWLFQAICDLYKYLRKSYTKYDFILVIEYRAQLVYSFIFWLIKKKFAVTVHGTEVNTHFYNSDVKHILLKRLIHKCFDKACKIIAVSNSTANLIHRYNPEWSNKLRTVLHGIEISDFGKMNDSEKIKVRKELGFSPKDKIIVSISRIIKEKGQDMLIRSLPLIIKKVPNVKLVIIGDGPYIENLRNLVEGLYVSGHVIFTGKLHRKDLAYWLKSSDIFALISREGKRIEGFGLVYLEANACGKAVIAGRTGGVPEAVEDGVSGLLVSPADINDISSKIIKLLTDDRMREELGKKGYERVIKYFTNIVMANRTVNALLDS